MEEKQTIFCDVDSCKWCGKKFDAQFFLTCQRNCIQVTTMGCLAYEEKKKELDEGYQE